MGTQLPHKKGHSSPHFSTHVCCGQTAEWIMKPLGTEAGLGPGDIVLHGDPTLSPRKGAQHPPPIFGPRLLWPNGCPSQQCGRGRGLPEVTPKFKPVYVQHDRSFRCDSLCLWNQLPASLRQPYPIVSLFLPTPVTSSSCVKRIGLSMVISLSYNHGTEIR